MKYFVLILIAVLFIFGCAEDEADRYKFKINTYPASTQAIGDIALFNITLNFHDPTKIYRVDITPLGGGSYIFRQEHVAGNQTLDLGAFPCDMLGVGLVGTVNSWRMMVFEPDVGTYVSDPFDYSVTWE